MSANYDPDKHQRRSIRLRDYDYAQAGAYFVTICTWDRAPLFGVIVGGEIRLNDRGRIAEEEWSRAGVLRSSVTLDAFVIMPNHVHGILVLSGVGATRRVALGEATPRPYERPLSGVGATRRVALGEAAPRPYERPRGAERQSLGAIVAQFKSAASKRIRRASGVLDLPIWQRNYHEHVIRGEADLTRLREYIVNNPMKWAEDEYYRRT